jgi:hypothetical protein
MNMKKYLMTGIAALAMGGIFTSCSHDMNQYTGNQSEQVLEKYEQVFVNAYGEPADNQTWGFGSATVAGTRGMTRSNPGVDYPSTSTGINANANEWADPDKEFGGWVVPDPLTDEQKEVVKAYFQANPNLTFQDPEWRHFFVQQVYKGKTAPGTNSTEEVTAADNSKYTSDNMNLLTVGEIEQHINNFNSGNCSVNGNVLDNGGNVNSGPYHSDQIMLMVNIDDTQCFGYHNTGMSLQRNDKAALVGWQTIRTWANSNGLNGDCLDDKWNRSFLGFDFELFSLEDSYANNNGEIIYAKMTDGQNGGLQYVWDGSNVVSKGVEGIPDLDLTSQFNKVWNNSESIDNNADGTITYHAAQWGGLVDEINNAIDFSTYKSVVVEFAEATPVKTQIYLEFGDQWGKWGDFTKAADAGVTELELDFASNYLSNLNKIRQVALQAADAGDLKISKIYLKGEEGEEGFGNYLLVDGEKVPFLNSNMNQYSGTKLDINDSDMKINKDGKECFNMEKIKDLVDDGYLPVKDKNLRTWVKWAGGDGYFSDWIVTLSRAKRIDEGEGGGDDDFITEEIRVIAEDLNAKENSDFDFNDVVFDVLWSYNDDKSTQEVKVKLLACGAEYSIYIGSDDNNFEIHEAFAEANPGRGITLRRYDINTVDGHDKYTYPEITLADDCWSGTTIKDIAKSILVRVSKSGILYELEAPKGKAPGKIAVGTDFDWCDEREDIDAKYYFKEWVGDKQAESKWKTWYKQVKE